MIIEMAWIVEIQAIVFYICTIKVKKMGIIQKIDELYRSLKLLWNIKVKSLPVAINGNPRPIIIYEGQFYYWDPDDKSYKTVSSSGVPAHTHIGADITDLGNYLMNWLITSEAYADGLFATIVGTPTPAVAFDTIQEIAAYLEADQTAMASILTALGNRVRVDTNAQGLNSTEKLNARTNIDLDQVNNTSDLDKPVSTATSAAILAAVGNSNFKTKRYSIPLDSTANSKTDVGFAPSQLGATVTAHGTLTTVGVFGGRFPNLSFQASSSASAVAGLRSQPFCFIGDGSTLGGGFLINIEFCFRNSITGNANHRFYAGLKGGTSSIPTNVNSSTLGGGLVGFGCDDSDSFIQCIHNDTSGGATKDPTVLPKSTTDYDDVYRCTFYSDGVSGSVTCTIVNLRTNVSHTQTVSSDLPTPGTILHIYCYMSTGTITGGACYTHISWEANTP